MRWITRATIWAIGLPLCLFPAALRAGEDVNSLMCAIQQTIDCGYQQTCLNGDAESLNLPAMFSVSLKEKIIEAQHGDGNTQVTKIDHLKVTSDQWVLQGFEKRSWSITIFKPDYLFSGSAIELDTVLGMFGACAVQRSSKIQ